MRRNPVWGGDKEETGGRDHGEGRQHRGGKKHGGRGRGRGGRGGHGGRDGRHHGRGGHIKWCLGFGAFLFLAMVTTFSVIFKKFVRAFRSYHSLVELRASSSAMSLEERNRICRDATEANCRSRKALRKQQSRQNAAQPQYSYVPPCEPPSVESALLR